MGVLKGGERCERLSLASPSGDIIQDIAIPKSPTLEPLICGSATQCLGSGHFVWVYSRIHQPPGKRNTPRYAEQPERPGGACEGIVCWAELSGKGSSVGRLFRMPG